MATKRPYQLPAVTAFRSDDKIIVDSQTNGTGAMGKDDLLRVTAENAIAVADILQPSVNLLDINASGVLLGKYVAANGNIFSDPDYNLSDYIEVDAGKTYSFNEYARYIATYNNGVFVARTENSKTYTCPASGVTHIRLNFSASVWNGTMVVEGTAIPSSYRKGRFLVRPDAVDFGSKNVPTDALKDSQVSPNIFDKDAVDVASGRYIDSSGSLLINPDYNTSGLIPVEAGETYTLSSQVRFLGEWNNGVLVSPRQENKTSYTCPASGVTHIRISNKFANDADWSKLMLVKGSDVPSVYYHFGSYISDYAIPPSALNENIPVDALKDRFLSPNIFNKNASDKAIGKYIFSNGELYNNASYNTSGYIDVEAGETYTFSSSCRFFGEWNGSTFVQRIENVTSYTCPASGVTRIKFTCSATAWDSQMMVKGSTLPPFYYNYGYYISDDVIPPRADSLSDKSVLYWVGDSSFNAKSASLSANTALNLTDYPRNMKKGMDLSCKAKFSSFTSMALGIGKSSYRGVWIEVDGTNVVCKKYEESEIVVGTAPHGLTFTNYISASIHTKEDSTIVVELNTTEGTFKTTFSLAYEFNGVVFASFGMAMTDVKLSAFNSDFKKKIWMFGDSYFGMNSDARWPYYAVQDNILDYMINGLAGRGSAAAYDDLVRCLKVGCPKYLVWAMGMNDATATWQTNVAKVKNLCDNLGIELILCTIPTTPTRDKETITSDVRSSGYRYIDFYDAVGADSSGNWYTGMLSADNVHPYPAGAKALYAQVLLDFPEIMGCLE